MTDKERFMAEVDMQLNRTIMPWDDEMREWHKWAIYALQFASSRSTNWYQDRWGELYEQPEEGLNLNVISVLCNNLVASSQHTLELDLPTYQTVLKMNARMIERWYSLSNPIQQSVHRRYEIMGAQKQSVMKSIHKA